VKTSSTACSGRSMTTGYDRDLDQEWVRFLEPLVLPAALFRCTGCRCWPPTVAQMAPASPPSPIAPRSSRPTSLRRPSSGIAYRTVQLSGPPLEIGTARRQGGRPGRDAEAFQPLARN